MARRTVKRPVAQRLQDILEAIENAEEFLDGSDYSAYEKSLLKRRAVERCLEIISEATRMIPAPIKNDWPDVPWDEIKAIGNVLRHAYQHVEDLVIWRTVIKDLPVLRVAIRRILEELEKSKNA